MAELRELSVNQFVEETASKASVPGGGSVSAMVGALGAALMEMVANLTIGKEKYAGVQEEMQALAAEGAALHEELLAGIKKDSESFNGYMRALKLPTKVSSSPTPTRGRSRRYSSRRRGAAAFAAAASPSVRVPNMLPFRAPVK